MNKNICVSLCICVRKKILLNCQGYVNRNHGEEMGCEAKIFQKKKQKNSYSIAWIIKRLEKINWFPLLMLLWSMDWSFLHPPPRCRRVSWGPTRNGSPSLLPGGCRSWVHWLRYIWGEQVFWGGETVNSDLFSSYLSCTVIATLLSYSKDSALNTLTFRFWMLRNDTVLQKPDCISVGKLCFMPTPLQLQTSEEKLLQYPISNHLVFIYSFTFHALFTRIFFCENLWKSEKTLKTSNSERVVLWWPSRVLDIGLKLQIYFPWRWGANMMLALNVREAGAAGIAAITATWWRAQSAGSSARFWERREKSKEIWLSFFTVFSHNKNL